MATVMESHTQGIGELIQQKRTLQVPDHQRDFAWRDEEEVEQFFADVVRAMDSSADDYFLGLLVLVRPTADGQWGILDGQQRLATTTMIYSAIRTWLRARGMDDDVNTIQNGFIGIRDFGEDDHKPRLTLNINDREAFREFVVDECAAPVLEKRLGAAARYSSERKLIGAVIACRKLVDAYAEKDDPPDAEQAKRLFDLARFLRDDVNVVAMEVDSTSSAYTIFETLNDRGLDLSVLDLVKNHLFARAGAGLDEVQASWAAMAANLGDRPADDFLKVWWTSRFGRIQRGKLFTEWRTKYDSESARGVAGIARELAAGADRYAALDVPDHDIWSSHNDHTSVLLGELIGLGHGQIRPLLMAALENFNADSVERLLVLLRTFVMRYQTVGRRRTGLFEIAMARAALGVADGRFNSPQKVWDDVKGLVPTDNDFRADFTGFTDTKSARVRYMLAQLETAARAAARGTPSDVRPWLELTLEHILPRNPSKDWDPALGADPDLKDHVNHIGNLCLLQDKLGRGVGNKGFATKKPVYAGSELVLTQEVASESDWDLASITRRQRRLADLAVAVWPLP